MAATPAGPKPASTAALQQLGIKLCSLYYKGDLAATLRRLFVACQVSGPPGAASCQAPSFNLGCLR